MIDRTLSKPVEYTMFWKKQRSALLVSFILPLCLFLSVFGAEGALLCFGEDGHVAVEFIDSCNGLGLGSELAGDDSDTCGPCKDVQFLSGPAYTNHASHFTQTPPLSSLPPMSSALHGHENSVNRTDPQAYSYQHKTLARLQSVVLLI